MIINLFIITINIGKPVFVLFFTFNLSEWACTNKPSRQVHLRVSLLLLFQVLTISLSTLAKYRTTCWTVSSRMYLAMVLSTNGMVMIICPWCWFRKETKQRKKSKSKLKTYWENSKNAGPRSFSSLETVRLCENENTRKLREIAPTRGAAHLSETEPQNDIYKNGKNKKNKK